MPSLSKGGRGKQAPYTTTHYRIPTPIKETVEQFAAMYRTYAGNDNLNECKALINRVQNAIADVENSAQKIKELETDLEQINKEIEMLRVKTNKALTRLEVALDLKSREGTKMKEIIINSIKDLKQYLDSNDC